MHRCPKCNHEVDPRSPICPNCGERLFEQKGFKYFFFYSFSLALVIGIILTLAYSMIVISDIIFLVKYTNYAKINDYISITIHSLCLLLAFGSIIYIIVDKKNKREIPVGLLVFITSIDLLYIGVSMILRQYEAWIITFRLIIAALGLTTSVLTLFKDKFLYAKKIMIVIYGILLCFSVLPFNLKPADISYNSELFTVARNIIADVGIGFILYGAIFYRKRMLFASTAIKVDEYVDMLNPNMSHNNFDEIYLELIKLKDLYDKQIITEEEYEQKRKELLSKLGK